MALINIVIDMGSDSYSELDSLQSEKGSLPKVINLLEAINSGVSSGSVVVEANAIQATDTFTLSASGQVEDEVFTINDVTFTFKDSAGGSYSGKNVEISGLIATTAANMAAAVNAATDVELTSVVTASSSSGVATVTSDRGGLSGNAITVSTDATNVTAAAGVAGTAGTSTSLTSG